MGIVVIGAIFVDIKGFPDAKYIPDGRNVGRVEYVHGGVCRNVAENIANVELCPTFLSIIDETGMGTAVLEKLNRHRVETKYILKREGGMGTYLAVFDNNGDLAGSISQRADLLPLLPVLEEHGDEIFRNADSVVFQADLHKDLIRKILELAEKYGKKLYAVVSNMSIAVERRDLIRRCDCFVCNQLEAGQFFAEDYTNTKPKELMEILAEKVKAADMNAMVISLGGKGSVYADRKGEKGYCPAHKVNVVDTTGGGDAFFSGITIGLTYGKSLEESVEIGTRLAASVITSSENVCPRLLPLELGINI